MELRKELKIEVKAEFIIKPKQKCDKLHIFFSCRFKKEGKEQTIYTHFEQNNL